MMQAARLIFHNGDVRLDDGDPRETQLKTNFSFFCVLEVLKSNLGQLFAVFASMTCALMMMIFLHKLL